MNKVDYLPLSSWRKLKEDKAGKEKIKVDYNSDLYRSEL